MRLSDGLRDETSQNSPKIKGWDYLKKSNIPYKKTACITYRGIRNICSFYDLWTCIQAHETMGKWPAAGWFYIKWLLLRGSNGRWYSSPQVKIMNPVVFVRPILMTRQGERERHVCRGRKRRRNHLSPHLAGRFWTQIDEGDGKHDATCC